MLPDRDATCVRTTGQGAQCKSVYQHDCSNAPVECKWWTAESRAIRIHLPGYSDRFEELLCRGLILQRVENALQKERRVARLAELHRLE